jgi:hypothetical protein
MSWRTGAVLSPHQETLALEWVDPAAAIKSYEDGEINLLPPQYCILTELSSRSFNDLNNERFDVEPIFPERVKGEKGFMVLPGDFKHFTATFEEKVGNTINRMTMDGNKIRLMQPHWRRPQPIKGGKL